MTTALGRAMGIGLVAAATLAIAAMSRAPWRPHPEAGGAVRISLSARPDRLERCRTLSPEELADVPVHMRQEVVCEGTAARYQLTVEVGGNQLADLTLTGGGAREDRPIHALHEFPLAAGRHHLSVRWARTDSTAGEPGEEDSTTDRPGAGLSRERGERASEQRDRRRREAVPARLALDTLINVLPRRVVLITYDAAQRRLRALSSPRDH